MIKVRLRIKRQSKAKNKKMIEIRLRIKRQ